MISFGKTIKIHLKGGPFSGIKVGEIVNNTIQAVLCSRLRIEELIEFPQIQKPGVYFLFGQDSQTNKPKAYIGESDNAYARLKTHITSKDFWSHVIFFVSKDENLTKAHVKYLESRIMHFAKVSNRYIIDNPNGSKPASLPLSDRDAMEEFLFHIRILLEAFNYPILEDPLTYFIFDNEQKLSAMPQSDHNKNARELTLNISGLRAEALQTDEGIVVLKGSQASISETDALQMGYKTIRLNLISNEVLKPVGKYFSFMDNSIFKSPSSAASVIAGYNVNGLQSWKDSSGRSLNEIEGDK